MKGLRILWEGSRKSVREAEDVIHRPVKSAGFEENLRTNATTSSAFRSHFVSLHLS